MVLHPGPLSYHISPVVRMHDCVPCSAVHPTASVAWSATKKSIDLHRLAQECTTVSLDYLAIPLHERGKEITARPAPQNKRTGKLCLNTRAMALRKLDRFFREQSQRVILMCFQ